MKEVKNLNSFTYSFQKGMGFTGKEWRKLNFFVDYLLLKLLSVCMCEWWLKFRDK